MLGAMERVFKFLKPKFFDRRDRRFRAYFVDVYV